MGVFDNFLWTQLFPWWWITLGVASAGTAGQDHIFRAETEKVPQQQPPIQEEAQRRFARMTKQLSRRF
jgi:hypothetical protein